MGCLHALQSEHRPHPAQPESHIYFTCLALQVLEFAAFTPKSLPSYSYMVVSQFCLIPK